MGETTNISWADATWNPWYGCHKVSPGCKFCYMYRDMERYGRDPVVVQRSKTMFDAPVRWKEPKRIFTCSWSDWFIEEADDWRTEAWDIIRHTPQHTYLILTKRPERIRGCLPAGWGSGWENVWLGVSAENQEWADKRIPWLVEIPAVVHFISAEPLLQAIDLSEWLTACSSCGERPTRAERLSWKGHWRYNGQSWEHKCEGLHPQAGHMPTEPAPFLDWVIVGGESGPEHRPMSMAWARWMRDRCVAAGVPFFFKQDSDGKPGQRPWIVEEDGSHTEYHEFPVSTKERADVQE